MASQRSTRRKASQMKRSGAKTARKPTLKDKNRQALNRGHKEFTHNGRIYKARRTGGPALQRPVKTIYGRNKPKR